MQPKGDVKMKLNRNFVTQNVGDTQFMVATGSESFSGMVRSNRSAAFIIDCLRYETTKEEIVEKMLEKYEVDEETVSRDVDVILASLRRIGAVEE